MRVLTALAAIVGIKPRFANCLAAAVFAALACGQSPEPSTVKGAIAGRLLDENGQPLAGWHIIVGHWQYRHGRKEFDLLVPRDTSTGDDGGFLLGDLDPGTYSVRAENPYLNMPAMLRDRIPPLLGPKRPGEAYVTTYYPGVTDVNKADAIEVTAGAPVKIEFRMQNAPVYHARGRLGIVASVRPQGSVVPEDAHPVYMAQGATFDVDGLLPGTYVFDGSNMQQAVRTVVTVTDHDLDVVLQQQPCPRIGGRLTIDGPLQKSELIDRFMLSHLDGAASYGGGIDNDGNIKVTCAAPGTYEVSMALRPGMYIKSITIDGKDFTNKPLDLTSFGDKTLDIAVSTHAGELRGAVKNASGSPLAGVPVTAWTDDYNDTADTAPDGSFEIGNLPPGVYRVAAWEQLHTQPRGWGVETVHEFRDRFTSAAAVVSIGESQHASVTPALIPRRSIEEAASRLHLNAVMTNVAEASAISVAAKSPITLAQYLKTHKNSDWDAMWKALGVPVRDGIEPRCGLSPEESCATQIIDVANPDQAILVVETSVPRSDDIYLRYMKTQDGGWQFAGQQSVFFNEGVREHEITRVGNKPFLTTLSDHGQNGVSIQQRIQSWFDLTQPGLEPVFSFTIEGSEWGFAQLVGRSFKATLKPSVIPGGERIDVSLDMSFDGIGMSFAVPYSAVYERRAMDKKFVVRAAYAGSPSTPISGENFQRLADPFEGPSKEKLLVYAFPGLQKIASGSDGDARGWLELVLERAGDTPEKRALMQLLGKR